MGSTDRKILNKQKKQESSQHLELGAPPITRGTKIMTKKTTSAQTSSKRIKKLEKNTDRKILNKQKKQESSQHLELGAPPITRGTKIMTKKTTSAQTSSKRPSVKVLEKELRESRDFKVLERFKKFSEKQRINRSFIFTRVWRLIVNPINLKLAYVAIL